MPGRDSNSNLIGKAVDELSRVSIVERFSERPDTLKVMKALGIEGQKGLPPLVRCSSQDRDGKRVGTASLLTFLAVKVCEVLPPCRSASEARAQIDASVIAVEAAAYEKSHIFC